MYLQIEKIASRTGIFYLKYGKLKRSYNDAHIKYDSHLKVEPTYNEILRARYRWDNMLIDIRDFYFKWQVWEIRTSKPRKNAIVKHIESYKPKERYQTDTVILSNYIWDGLNISLQWWIISQSMDG